MPKVRNMKFDAEQMIFLENFFSKMEVKDASLKFDMYLTETGNEEEKLTVAEKMAIDDGRCTGITKKGIQCSKNKSKLNSVGLCAVHFKTSGVSPPVAKAPVTKRTKVETSTVETIDQLFEDVEKDISPLVSVVKSDNKTDSESDHVSDDNLSGADLSDGEDSVGGESEDLFGEE